jgi:hypothetical protein
VHLHLADREARGTRSAVLPIKRDYRLFYGNESEREGKALKVASIRDIRMYLSILHALSALIKSKYRGASILKAL